MPVECFNRNDIMRYKWTRYPFYKEEKIHVWHQIHEIMTDRCITTILERFGYEPQERDIHINTIGMESKGLYIRRMHLYQIPIRATTEEGISTENDYNQE